MNTLKKDLGFFEIYCLATGTMISSGIFILPGMAFLKTGPAIFVSYFFSGILALLGLMSIVELSSAMPKAGGDYFYITRSLDPLTGTISGLISWLGLSLKTAFCCHRNCRNIIDSFRGQYISIVNYSVSLLCFSKHNRRQGLCDLSEYHRGGIGPANFSLHSGWHWKH